MAALKLKPGIVTGNALTELFDYCQQSECALPAVNVIGSHSTNAALQAAREAKAPIIIQLSNGGAHFFGGKFLPNGAHEGEIAGAVAAAHYVRSIVDAYGTDSMLIVNEICASSDASDYKRVELGTLGDFFGLTGGGAPGSDTQIIYNDTDVLGADGSLTWDETQDILAIGPSAGLVTYVSNEGMSVTNSTAGTDLYLLLHQTENANAASTVDIYMTAGNAASATIWFADNGGDRAAIQATTGDALLFKAGASLTDVASISTVFHLVPLASAPGACAIGDFYSDTSGAACACTATNTWTNMTPLTGSCA